MLLAPLLDYTEHNLTLRSKSSMSGGGPEQSEVISAVNTSFISLGAESNTRHHSIYLKQGRRGDTNWIQWISKILVFYIGRNNKKLDGVFGFVKLFAEVNPMQKFDDRIIGVEKVLRTAGCVMVTVAAVAVVSRD